MPVTVREQDGGNTVEIAVDGRFDFNVHQAFKNAYEQHGRSDSQFVIDLGATEYMDSSALGMLLVLREYAGGSDAQVELRNCSPETRKLLEIANYEKLFRIDQPAT